MVAFLVGGEEQRDFISKVKTHVPRGYAAAMFVGAKPDQLSWVSTRDGIGAHLVVLFASSACDAENAALHAIVEMLGTHQTPVIVVYYNRHHPPPYLLSDAGLNVRVSFMPQASFGMAPTNGFSPKRERLLSREENARQIAEAIVECSERYAPPLAAQ